MDPPSELVRRLNALGFAVQEPGPVLCFARTALESELHVTVEALAQDRWRVGAKWRHSRGSLSTPNPLVPIALSRLGHSSDGETIDLSTGELLTKFPAFLEKSILPMVDLAPS